MVDMGEIYNYLVEGGERGPGLNRAVRPEDFKGDVRAYNCVMRAYCECSRMPSLTWGKLVDKGPGKLVLRHGMGLGQSGRGGASRTLDSVMGAVRDNLDPGLFFVKQMEFYYQNGRLPDEWEMEG